MATDFTQDSVLFFLQSSGGSVKNSDLLVHFRAFLQDAKNRDRNRELFKKFVNSVAIVKQVDGVSHVLLRKKFKGHVSGGGAGRDSPGSAGNYTEPSAVTVSAEPEVSLPPPGETRREAVIQAAGIVGKNQKNEEMKITQKPKEQQVNIRNISPEPVVRPVQMGAQHQVNISPDPLSRQVQKGGKQQVNLRNISPEPANRHLQMVCQQQVNIRNVSPEPVIRPVQMGAQHQVNISPDPLSRQVQKGGQQQVNIRNISPEPVIRQVQMGGQQQVNLRNISPEPANRHVQMVGQQQVNIRNVGPEPVIRPVQMGAQHQVNISPDPLSRQVQKGGQQQVNIRNISPEPVIRQVQMGVQQQVNLRNISPEPANRHVQMVGQQQVNIRNVSPEPVIRPVQMGAQQWVKVSPDPLIRQIQMGGQPQLKVSSDPVTRPVLLGGQQQVSVSPEPLIRPVQIGGLSEPSGPDQNTRLGQPTVRLQEPGPPKGPGPGLQQVPGRRFRHRPSYKSAVSQDDDEEEEEEEEEVPVRPGPGGGLWPQKAPLSDSERTLPSFPCIPESPESSSSSGRTQSHMQLTEEEIPVPRDLLGVKTRLEAGSVPMETSEHYGAPLVTTQGPGPQKVPGQRFKHRPSYKTAVSQDDDEEDKDEGTPVRPGPGGGPWPQSAPGRTISGSSPGIPESSESCSSSSGRTVPHICIQHTEEDETPVPQRPEPGSVPMEMTQRRSLPSESDSAGRYPRQNQTRSSSPSTILRPSTEDQFYSGDQTEARSPGWNTSSEGTQAEEPAGLKTIQEVQASERTPVEPAAYKTVPWHRSTGNLYDEEPSAGRLSPLYRFTDCLHDDEHFAPRAKPWRLSTGDLCDDREEAESSEGSTSSPQVQLRSAVARRLSSRLRSRMCRSLGTDLDQIVQEEGGAGVGSEAARLDRLHRISSSISLFYNRSTSSLSSCTTPPRCPSPANQVEGEEKRQGRRSLNSTTSHAQSPVPLEPKEHAWMVNGAVGAWTEIFSLFREDPSLLNKRDFISGFTVLHWIAKHGAHRALNTLWYGAEKFGLTFDINAKATGGQTPLHVAAIHGHKKVIQLLVVKFQADMRLRDTAGKRAWQYLDSTAPDILQLLGAPARAALTERGGPDDSHWQPKRQRHGLRHHFSSASGQRPLTFTQFAKVTRSSSIAALLKHKSMPRF